MPLHLDSPSEASEGGQFYDKLRFNAQGGVWIMKTIDGETRLNNGFKAIFDMENLETGWSKFNGTYVDFIADPSITKPAPRPADDGDNDNKWKRAFKVLAYSKDAFGGTLEFMHSARTVTGAFNELYAAYEKQAENGKVPVISVNADPTKKGDYYAPSWSLDKMVPRPDSIGSTAAAPSQEKKGADEEF